MSGARRIGNRLRSIREALLTVQITLQGESMHIHNLYTDANGESHFRDIEIEWAEERRGSKLSKRLPVTGIIACCTLWVLTWNHQE